LRDLPVLIRLEHCLVSVAISDYEYQSTWIECSCSSGTLRNKYRFWWDLNSHWQPLPG
jgi:hypothetical protein